MRCDCDKIRYRTEQEALVAAELNGELFDTEFRAYKCPGHSTWHLATRGFHPRALKSRARIAAWHLSTRKVMTRDVLFEQLGLTGVEALHSSRGKKLSKVLTTFAKLGLIRQGHPRPPYITVTDQEGLRRVMTVGLEEYEQSRNT